MPKRFGDHLRTLVPAQHTRAVSLIKPPFDGAGEMLMILPLDFETPGLGMDA
jgi:hypothetical protein